MEEEGYHNQLQVLLNPDTVYHYTCAQVAIEYILNDKRLRLSPFSSTNDPLEYHDIPFGGAHWGDIPDADKNYFTTEKKLTNYFRKNLRFVSFCRNKEFSEIDNTDINYEIPNRLGCLRPRMWSQYGDGHKGVCIAFSLTELEKQLELHGKIFHGFYSERVDYFGFPVVSVSDISLDGNLIAKKGVDAYTEEFINLKWKDLLFRKHEDYRDEIEHRIILKTEKANDNYLFIDITKSIKAIILGDKFNPIYDPILTKQAKETGVFIKKLFWRNGEFILLDNIY